LFSTTILNIAESCPKQAIVPGFSDDTSTPNLFAMFCNASTPHSKLSFESAIIT
jgi:hypothetical protein